MKRVIALVVAVLVLGAWSGESQPTPSGQLSARIVLPSHTLRAGSSMTARVVVDNETGAAVHVASCGSPFAVALRNRHVKPSVVWTLCRTDFVIPTGRSTWSVIVLASLLMCTNATPTATMPACLPGGGMPPLPPGRYHAALYQQPTVVTDPHTVPVRVTATS